MTGLRDDKPALSGALLSDSVLLQARVGRLATVAGEVPHLVPVVFVYDGTTVWIPVDGKSKRHLRLKRLENIRANPRVCLLIDHYDEDWGELWWVRVDANARHVRREQRVLDALAAKYPQYTGNNALPVQIHSLIRLDIERVSQWRPQQHAQQSDAGSDFPTDGFTGDTNENTRHGA